MEKNCLNCKEWPTYGTVCNPFDEDPAKHSCSGHTLDRNLMLKMMTALEAEIVRLKIAHLRRMAEACEALESRALAFAFPDPTIGWTDDRYWKIIEKVDRFRSACLAKITELKESRCSTKP